MKTPTRFKLILPHVVAFIIIFILTSGMWGAMQSTNNNGEFGYPEEGIYDWGAILPILGIWFAIFFCIFELPIIFYQFVKYKTYKNQNSHTTKIG